MDKETIQSLSKRATNEADLLENDFRIAMISSDARVSKYYVKQAENRIEKIKEYIRMIEAL